MEVRHTTPTQHQLWHLSGSAFAILCPWIDTSLDERTSFHYIRSSIQYFIFVKFLEKHLLWRPLRQKLYFSTLITLAFSLFLPASWILDNLFAAPWT
ncbi:hypothetical protein E8E11_011054 [Didymella keratinophila]|nr:hypothetical protein E8E11_011054 [Didymella keratinophila]